MKTTKKLLALLLSALLLLSLLPAAFATGVDTDADASGDTPAEVNPSTDNNNYSLTITATENNREYELYQVFKGTLHIEGNTKILSDVVYGASWADHVLGDPVDDTTLQDYENGTGKENIDKFLDHKGNFLKKVKATGTTAMFEGLPAGYYVVLEVGEVTGYAAKSEHIIQVVGDTSIAAKMDVPTSQKKVKDTNDSTGETTGWQDSADYDIGDNVPFQLTATLPENILRFKGPYALTFHDEQSEGLTFNSDSVKVYLNTVSDADLIPSSYYKVKTTDLSDTKCTFEIHFDNLKDITGVTPGSKIIVEYTSTLNGQAEIGSKGNPNEMYIKFSNNPNSDEPEENGKTPVDKVIVFTYRFDVFKLDGTQADAGEQAPLPGATFTLYKKVNNAYTKEIGTIESKNAEHGGTIFRFTGLDDGDYKLMEVKAPDGYNTAEDVYFTITASHEVESDNPQLINLGCKYRSGQTGTANEITGSVSGLNDGSVLINVLNYRGNTLPSTGGMGTTVFYVLGSILAVGAAILLVSKKRMNGAR